MDSGGEIRALEQLLATMRERLACGHEGAQRIITVLEVMIAEREQGIADEAESEPAAASDRNG